MILDVTTKIQVGFTSSKGLISQLYLLSLRKRYKNAKSEKGRGVKINQDSRWEERIKCSSGK